MGIRSTVGSALESTIGRERTSKIRKVERRARLALARKLTMEPPKKPVAKASARPPTKPAKPEPQPAAKPLGWQPPDQYASHPRPAMRRHDLLLALHEKTRPRTYLEIGVETGASMMLSRTRSIGVDPSFNVDKPIHCDVQLVRSTSDDFFAGDDPLAHFGGVPVDLAFIDGMHLSEFALRDFINTEPLMASTGVVVFDDMLPRNVLEAARDRKTSAWAGDVYKVVEILRRRRPDLVVLLVNTAPTGTAVVVGVDQASTILKDAYRDEEEYLLRPDPQSPPPEYVNRSIAIQPDVLLASPVWDKLLACREAGASADLGALWDELRNLEHE
jgi:hypothetical protein